jgi:hypothetical protein
VFSLGVNGDIQDEPGDGGVTSFGLTDVIGRLDLRSRRRARRRLQHRAHQRQLQQAAVQRVAPAAARRGLVARTPASSGQAANKNLDVSEKMELGGINAVRAYPEGEAYGDQGAVANVEARWDLPAWDLVGGHPQLVAFVDGGRVYANHRNWTGTRSPHARRRGPGRQPRGRPQLRDQAVLGPQGRRRRGAVADAVVQPLLGAAREVSVAPGRPPDALPNKHAPRTPPMNHIYRSIWNDSTQTYVAVSEAARAPGGSGFGPRVWAGRRARWRRGGLRAEGAGRGDAVRLRHARAGQSDRRHGVGGLGDDQHERLQGHGHPGQPERGHQLAELQHRQRRIGGVRAAQRQLGGAEPRGRQRIRPPSWAASAPTARCSSSTRTASCSARARR